MMNPSNLSKASQDESKTHEQPGIVTKTKLLNGRVNNHKGTFGPNHDSPGAAYESPEVGVNGPDDTIHYIPFEELESLDNPEMDFKRAV
jgi:hypothetical protein